MKNKKKMRFAKKSKAFTLVELLVVATIVALLAVVLLVNLDKARAKSRDSQRKSDISKIAAAVEGFKVDNKFYIATCADQTGYPRSSCPLSGGTSTYSPTDVDPAASAGILRVLVGSGYITTLPKDPSRSGTDEFYKYNSSGERFKLTAQSETIKNPAAPNTCTTASVVTDAKLKAGDFYDSSTGATNACSRFQISSDSYALIHW